MSERDLSRHGGIPSGSSADGSHSARPADPAPFRLGGEPPQVMRLSRKALAFGGGLAACAIAGALFYALQPRVALPRANLYEPQANAKPDALAGAPASYDKVPKLGPPLPGDLGRPILAAQQEGTPVPVPPMGTPPAPPVSAAAEADRRQADARQAAIASKLFLTSGSTTGSEQRVAAPATASPDSAQPGASTGREADGQAARRAFLSPDTRRVTASAQRIAAPVSSHALLAGSIIPAALITGIRSDLPGQITAQVTENVYDSATGRLLLIPQGSRLIGEYDSAVAAGQTRVLLAWDRLILPCGRSILLDRQPGADAAGNAGLQDRTNYHWGNMLKAALVSTMLGAGTQLVAQGDDELTRALRYGLQDTINQTGRQLVQREIAVPPTLTIRPGFALRVLVTRDIVLDPADGEGGQ
ncbi:MULTISPECIES: TrbI/VirB10 family protein [unclassified Novosphingobium]|uniref:TrbI/VirB10 family protein n=1 Tax=unclassified Novosphingobium TaxID=2644732 RepID=UPI0014699EFF|nr:MULTISPECIES: TrbI/VirB10 family protein [unclassified Novosphingobium]NMN03895.1 type IV secretion system protein VirB10 [Novosphingobium sp. SG919]NMN86115.1 type IV secretion system protein VirB10 [Novosphingobium sp. SG916]